MIAKTCFKSKTAAAASNMNDSMPIPAGCFGMLLHAGDNSAGGGIRSYSPGRLVSVNF